MREAEEVAREIMGKTPHNLSPLGRYALHLRITAAIHEARREMREVAMADLHDEAEEFLQKAQRKMAAGGLADAEEITRLTQRAYGVKHAWHRVCSLPIGDEAEDVTEKPNDH